MFIVDVAADFRSFGRSAMSLGNTRCSAPPELKRFLRARFYKHCVPPGLKTKTKPNVDWRAFGGPASCARLLPPALYSREPFPSHHRT